MPAARETGISTNPPKVVLKKSNHKIIAKKIYIVSAVIKPGCSLQLPGGPVVRSGNQAAGHGFARTGFAPVTVAPWPPVLRRGGRGCGAQAGASRHAGMHRGSWLPGTLPTGS